jgi:hypothetical protein
MTSPLVIQQFFGDVAAGSSHGGVTVLTSERRHSDTRTVTTRFFEPWSCHGHASQRPALTRAWLRISDRIRSRRGSVSRSTWVIIAPTAG